MRKEVEFFFHVIYNDKSIFLQNMYNHIIKCRPLEKKVIIIQWSFYLSSKIMCQYQVTIGPICYLKKILEILKQSVRYRFYLKEPVSFMDYLLYTITYIVEADKTVLLTQKPLPYVCSKLLQVYMWAVQVVQAPAPCTGWPLSCSRCCTLWPLSWWCTLWPMWSVCFCPVLCLTPLAACLTPHSFPRASSPSCQLKYK